MHKRQAEKIDFNTALWRKIGQSADEVLNMFAMDPEYIGAIADFAVSLTEIKTRFSGASEVLALVMSEVDDEPEDEDEEFFVGHRGFSGDMD